MQAQAKELEYEALKNNFRNLEEEYNSIFEQKNTLEQLYAEKVQVLTSTIEDLRTRNRILADQFSKDSEQKSQQIRQLTEKLESIKAQKEKEQPVYTTREVSHTQEIQRDLGGERVKASHLQVPGLGQSRPGRNASQSSIQNIVSRDVEDEQETQQRRSVQERGSVSARGSIRDSEDNQAIKEELKEAQKLLRIKTREYEENYKKVEAMRKELEEKESKIVQLEEEIQDRQEDYKVLYEEFSKSIKRDKENGETDNTVLEERIRELEEIVEDNQKELREKVQEQIRDLQKVIGKEVGNGLEKNIEELEREYENRIEKLNKQIIRCQQTMKFVSEEVSVWKNKALEAENELIRSLEVLDEVSKNKGELEHK